MRIKMLENLQKELLPTGFRVGGDEGGRGRGRGDRYAPRQKHLGASDLQA